jgi:translocation and assembly module TamA
MKQGYTFFALIIFMSTASSAVIKGIKNPEILSAVKSQISSDGYLLFSKDSPINKYRIENDKNAILLMLHSFGYFDVIISTNKKKGEVVFDINLGERYKFNNVMLIYLDNKNCKFGLTVKNVFKLIGTRPNSYTDTKHLSEAGTKIADYLKGRGFAFAKVESPELDIDRCNKKIKAIYKITLNGKSIFDKTVINIQEPLLKPFIQNRILWNDKDAYDNSKIEHTRDMLMDSGIFSNIEVSLQDPKIDKTYSHTNVVINADEAPPRDIAVGAKYGTSEKIGFLFSWTHYNTDRKGSKFSTLLDVSKRTKITKLKYDIYDPLYKMQNLALQIFHIKEDALAYNVSKSGAEGILWQGFGSSLKLGAGLLYENSNTRDEIIQDGKTAFRGNCVKFNALGIPLGVNVDTTESLLDPNRGFRCSGTLTPYIGNLKNITIFNSKCSFYASIHGNTVTIAAYTKIGSILRSKKHVIPRDKLLFAGGANSVRGYGYQKVGTVNEDKKPIGGESVFEAGIEPRFRISDDVGVVVFLEGGNVCSSKLPHPFKKMMFGYGIGARYYTLLGPIRVDLALPTRRRRTAAGKRIDPAFNIYISIGQAF